MKKKVDKHNPFAALQNVKLPEDAKKAPPPPPPKPIRVTPEEERLAFHRLMSGVTALDGKARVPTVAPVERSVTQKTPEGARAEEVDASLRLSDLARPKFEVQDDGKHAEGRVSSIAPDMMRRLRRGQLAIDGRLDLHGLHVAEAKAALTEFLRKMRTASEKCVLVIHGKGRHSVSGEGVLRGEMSAWLSQGPASANVGAFASQTDPDGDSGSMLVLLRR